MQAEFVRVSHPDHDFRVAAEYAVVNLSNVVERYGTDNYRSLYIFNTKRTLMRKMINRMQVTFYCALSAKMSVVNSKINLTSLKITVPVVYN